MIPVQIELGNHVLQAQVHALPRPGDLLSCSFPTAGIPRLNLRVARVYFHQPHIEFSGRECPEPFAIVLVMEDDPEFAERNRAIIDKLARRE